MAAFFTTGFYDFEPPRTPRTPRKAIAEYSNSCFPAVIGSANVVHVMQLTFLTKLSLNSHPNLASLASLAVQNHIF
jgi:hypothetical protein